MYIFTQRWLMEGLTKELAWILTGPLLGQFFACASIRLTNDRALCRLTTFYAATQLVNRAEAQARGCPCRGPVRMNIKQFLLYLYSNICLYFNNSKYLYKLSIYCSHNLRNNVNPSVKFETYWRRPNTYYVVSGSCSTQPLPTYNCGK